jgi:hypothetical protein
MTGGSSLLRSCDELRDREEVLDLGQPAMATKKMPPVVFEGGREGFAAASPWSESRTL